MSLLSPGPQTDWHIGTSSSSAEVGHDMCSKHGGRIHRVPAKGCVHFETISLDEESQSVGQWKDINYGFLSVLL